MEPDEDIDEDEVIDEHPWAYSLVLEQELEFLEVMKESYKEDIKNQEREQQLAEEKLKTFRSVPLHVGQFLEVIDHDYCIVGDHPGLNMECYVPVLSSVYHELLKPSALAGLHRDFCSVVDVLPQDSIETKFLLSQSQRPDVTYADIGGYEVQKQELQEVVDLSLIQHELCEQIGIDRPRGVLLYGPPGTGKTMLVMAVANSIDAAFIRAAGPEFILKYEGGGPQMVCDIFHLAREHAPAIIFIDEVDAIASARFDAENEVDAEVQRTLIELLNQIDGSDKTVNIAVIMATNCPDSLDPALLRPGRIDRMIEFPLPNKRERKLIFQVCTAKMNLSDEVNLHDYACELDEISPAAIANICQEAGMCAIRHRRDLISSEDFEKALQKSRKNIKKTDTPFEFYS